MPLTKTLSLVLLLLVLWLIACSSGAGECLDGQEIIFSKLGNAIFSDSLLAACPDGSGVRTLLAPQRARSFIFGTGNSLQSPLIVLVHELLPDGQIDDRL